MRKAKEIQQEELPVTGGGGFTTAKPAKELLRDILDAQKEADSKEVDAKPAE